MWRSAPGQARSWAESARAAAPSARDRGVLELVELGKPSSRSRTRSIGRRAWAPSSPGRSISRTKTASSPSDERRDAPDVVVAGGRLVLLAHGVERAAVVDGGEGRVGVDAVARRAPPGRRPSSRRSRPWSWRAAKRARWTARNASGCDVADDACRPGGPGGPSRPAGRSQIGGSPSSTWTWPSENGTKVTSQSAPSASPASEVLVGVAGEGAAVVPGHGEGGHVVVPTSRAEPDIPPDSAGEPPDPLGDGGQDRCPPPRRRGRRRRGGSSRGPGWRRRPRPARSTAGRARLPVAQQRGGAEGGAGVAAREAAGERHPQVVGPLELGDRPLAVEQRLQHAVDEASTRRRGRRSAAATPRASSLGPQRPGRCRQVPEQAEVGELGDRVHDPVDRRLARSAVEGARRRRRRSRSMAGTGLARQTRTSAGVRRAVLRSGGHRRRLRDAGVGPATGDGRARLASGSSPPNAGQKAWKEHQAHSGPGLGRKSSRSQARSTACQIAPTLRRRPAGRLVGRVAR